MPSGVVSGVLGAGLAISGASQREAEDAEQAVRSGSKSAEVQRNERGELAAVLVHVVLNHDTQAKLRVPDVGEKVIVRYRLQQLAMARREDADAIAAATALG